MRSVLNLWEVEEDKKMSSQIMCGWIYTSAKDKRLDV